jgi:hypothetical protein
VALALVVFALAHNLTFLVTYGNGSGDALARTGHGAQWTAAVALIAILALALAAAGALRLAQLSRLARDLDDLTASIEHIGLRNLCGHLVRSWLVIFGCALVLFVGAENLEHVAAGLPAPGLSVLGSGEYHGALAIFAAVAFMAAMVDALYRWRRDVLVARIEAARTRWVRAHGSTGRPETPWIDRRHGAISGHRIAGRAPPLTTQ